MTKRNNTKKPKPKLKRSITTIAEHCTLMGYDLNTFTLVVIKEGYTQEEFNEWIESQDEGDGDAKPDTVH